MVCIQSYNGFLFNNINQTMESVDYEGSMLEQGGGHGRIRKCRVQPGNIPALAKPQDHCEANAYLELQKTPLKSVIPTFFGVHTENDEKNLIISDITSGFTSPCLADYKVGTRHYDLNASEEKKNGLIEKQKGSTTESIGVRLIDAQIRKGGEVVKSWDRKQGLKFSYEEFESVFNEFIPSGLRNDLSKRLDDIYSAYDETVNQYPGFRMYSGSLLIAYDGDNPSEIRAVLIDFAHTHISIDAEGGNSDDESFDDGVLQGIATLMNFEPSDEAKENPNKGLDVTILDDDGHKNIKRCIVNPGEHKCFIRSSNVNESSAYTQLSNTPLIDCIPKLYGIQNKSAVVEDIFGEFTSPCFADFKVGSKGYDIDDNADKIANAKAKDEKTTLQSLCVRLTTATLQQNGQVVKQWNRKEVVNYTEDELKAMLKEFVPPELAQALVKQLTTLKKAYQSTVKSSKNFRVYNLSVLIGYDGDDYKKTPRCVFEKIGGTHMDIEKENHDPKDKQFDDGVITGLENLISYVNPSSKCCYLL